MLCYYNTSYPDIFISVNFLIFSHWSIGSSAVIFFSWPLNVADCVHGLINPLTSKWRNGVTSSLRGGCGERVSVVGSCTVVWGFIDSENFSTTPA